MKTLWFVTFCVLVVSTSAGAQADLVAESVQFGGKRLDFSVGESRGFVILPQGAEASGEPRPWVWYAPTFIGRHPDESHGWMMTRLLDAGFAIGGVDVGESYGSPDGTRAYTEFYQHVIDQYDLDALPCLLAQSRGGLMLLNWAIDNPRRVQCIAGIYTVCNLMSYPGVDKAASAYGMTPNGLRDELNRYNPIERADVLADAQVPQLFIHGNVDVPVPLEKNAGEYVKRTLDEGGVARLIVVPGKGHEVCPEFFQSEELLAFLLSQGETLEHSSREEKPVDREWRHYAYDAGGTRYSPLSEINVDNVTRLERAWTYRTGDIAKGKAHYAECTPLVVDGVMYMITAFSRLIAVNAVTGEELWRFTPNPPLDLKETGGGGLASRGIAYSDYKGKRRIFLPVRDGRIYSIDVETHRPDPEFGESGHIDLRAGLPDGGRYLMLSSPPTIYKHVLVQPYGIADSSAMLTPYVPLRAYDARTGEPLWTFHTIPRPGRPGRDTWADDSGMDRAGVNPWAPISVDEERGIFYVPIGAPNSDKYGGDRIGDNLYSNCIVAINARTGKKRWHFQTVHHDLWDYDLPALPNLFTFRDGDELIPAVAVIGKTGFVYEFNRLNGKPLFPIEERPVPASDVPDEVASPTQPFPTKPPPFSRQQIMRDDLNDSDPRIFAALEKKLAGLRSEGIFTPPTFRGSALMPGQLGGGNWSGAAVSPDGMMYVTANELPYISQLKPGSGPLGLSPTAGHFRDAKGYPAIKPPWGTLTKLDLVKGELIWQRPLGNFDKINPAGEPPTGTLNFGGATATGGGLVFVAATMDEKLRAFDAETGQVVFETKLDAAGYGAPVTYLGQDGNQYVAIFAGGGGKAHTPNGDYVIAFRLRD